mgnify:FL=1
MLPKELKKLCLEQQKNLYEKQFYQEEKTDYLDQSLEDAEWSNLSFDLRLDRVAKLLNYQSTTRILDIGCGPGAFLNACKKRGWIGTGIEPSPLATAFCQGNGLNVRQGFVSETLDEDIGPFDVVHMSEVLEHVSDPLRILQTAHSIMVENGILAVSVPNDFNHFQRALVSEMNFKEWWVVPEHHVNYFSFESLEQLIAKAGFQVLERTTNFPMEFFLLMGQNYTLKPELGRQLHEWRKSFDMTLARAGRQTLNLLYDSLAKANLGRLAIAFAKKI